MKHDTFLNCTYATIGGRTRMIVYYSKVVVIQVEQYSKNVWKKAIFVVQYPPSLPEQKSASPLLEEKYESSLCRPIFHLPPAAARHHTQVWMGLYYGIYVSKGFKHAKLKFIFIVKKYTPD